MLIKKQSKELKAKIKECKDRFSQYLSSCKDNDKLNLLFTELTLFRARNDGKDWIGKNIVDFIKRKEDITKLGWINLQFDDILDNFTDNDSQYDLEFNELMKVILPEERNISGWEAFWNWFWSCFDKAAGKK